MFDTLQDRLQSAFKNLRGKGRLSEADIDAVAREIRVALLDADVAVSVVREFIANVKQRAAGAEVRDVFYVVDADGTLLDADAAEILRARLATALS